VIAAFVIAFWPMSADIPTGSSGGGRYGPTWMNHVSCGSVVSPRNANSGKCVDKVASHQRLALIVGVLGLLIAVGGGLFLAARREPAPADPVAT
jgi:hypothetical protein